MRRRFRWNPKTLRQEEILPTDSVAGITIIPDIEPFVSPIDGKMINGRKSLREHNKRHNVTNVADFKNEWAEKAKERERFFSGDTSYDKDRRIEHLRKAFEKSNRR